MPDPAHKPLNRQDVERVAHETLGRQLRLMVGMSALLLVLGFVVGQFTGAALARRNTERLQARVDQLEQTLARVEIQLDEGRDEHAELEQALIRIEDQRRSEIAVDRASLAATINLVEATRDTIHSDLDEFDVRHHTVPAVQVRRMVDRFASEQVHSMERLLKSQSLRIGLPAPVEISESPIRPDAPATELPDETGSVPDESRNEKPEATRTDAGNEVPPPPPEEPSVTASLTASVPVPPACRPGPPPLVVESGVPDAEPASDEPYVAPPRRRGFLFFAPSQPRRIDPARVSDSDSIPLPPR